MADKTAIEWTDATWQITTGCSVVSPGCANCYAQRLAGTRLQHHPSRQGLTTDSKAGPVWNGKVRFNEEWLEQPLHWKRPRRVFVSAHGDLFHENIADEWIDRVFAVMALAPQHTFQVLTKRAERMRDYIGARVGADIWQIADRIACDINLGEGHPGDMYLRGGARAAKWPLGNIWLGVSVEDQQRADERIPLLLDTPAAKRFISAEPLLGPIDISPWLNLMVESQDIPGYPAWTRGLLPSLDWCIVGGESGPGARPMHPEWVRKLRGDCIIASVPFFFKQHGEWLPGPIVPIAQGARDGTPGLIEPVNDRVAFAGIANVRELLQMNRVGKKAAGRMLDGRTWDEFPA